MPRPTKLTYEIQRRIGKNIALGLPYALAAESAGVTYQTFNTWMNKGKNSTSGKQYQFQKHIQKRNADAAKTCLERFNDAAEDGNCQVCMWILERRFPADFGRREYRKINAVSENKNANVDIIIKNGDGIRKEILDKLALVK